ncbi:hypothetical protein HK102_005915, partial [Quaeritorhiza haematococci]
MIGSKQVIVAGLTLFSATLVNAAPAPPAVAADHMYGYGGKPAEVVVSPSPSPVEEVRAAAVPTTTTADEYIAK